MNYSDYAEYYEYVLDSAEANQPANANESRLNHPLFRFENPLDNVVGLKIIEAVIPCTYYVVNSTNNTFVINNNTNPSTYNITVPPGTYTATSLSSTIKDLITTIAGGVWTVNFNPTNGKYTFSGILFGVPQEINLVFGAIGNDGATNMRLVLGFNAGATTFATNVTSQNVAQVSGPNYLYICSDQIGSYMHLHLPSVDLVNKGGLGPEMAMIPIDVNFMDVMYWKDHSSEFVFYTPGINALQSLDLYLTLGKDLPILDLNGLSFQVKLGILKRKDSQNAQMLGVKRMRAI